MLVIWSATEASILRKVLGSVLGAHPIPHRIDKDVNAIPSAGSGDVILACGGKCLATLEAAGLTPKKRTIGSLRESPLRLGTGSKLLVTYDPSIVSRDYARLPEIMWDAMLAVRLHDTGDVKPVIGSYQYVESLHNIIETIERRYEETGQPVDVACDLETLSTDEYNPDAWIIACSFTVEAGKSEILYFEKDEAPTAPPPWDDITTMDYWSALWTQINWILTSEKVSTRGANFKFDSRWLVQKWGIYCTNYKFDTLLVGSLLDENRSNSLKLHAKLFTTLGGYEDGMDKYDMGRLDLVPKAELRDYVGGDTDATLQVAAHFKTELLKDRRLTNFYVKLLHPSSKVFEQVERNGVYVDIPYYQQLGSELESEISRLNEAMVASLPNVLRIKYKDSIADSLSEGKNPLKPSILKEFLFSPRGLNLKPQVFTDKTKEPSTSLDHLMMFEDIPEAKAFVSLLREHSSASKTLSTYVIGFMKHLRADGRFHPTYMLFRGGYGDRDDDSGTNTGRTSAKDPAMQTLPKHTKWTKKLRRAFIAPPGMTILELDFSQGELRIAAIVAEEPTMLQAYRDNLDLHAITASAMNGYEFEEFMLLPDDVREELRSGGKAGNFGLLYGMQHLGFQQYAYVTYGVKMSVEEAQTRRTGFFDKYYRLPEWHEECKAHAHMHGQIRSPLGRVRHLPLINSKDREVVSQAERQSINAPIQATLSDMMQLAMVLIDREYGQGVIKIFAMTHDSIHVYVPIEDATLWANRLKAIMENLPLKKDFGWDIPIPFIADAKVGVPGDDGVISLANLGKLK